MKIGLRSSIRKKTDSLRLSMSSEHESMETMLVIDFVEACIYMLALHLIN